MSQLPVQPHHALMLLKSSTSQFKCSDEIMSVVAMREASDCGDLIFVPPKGKKEEKLQDEIWASFCCNCGDDVGITNAYLAYRNVSANPTALAAFMKEKMLKLGTFEEADRIRRKLLVSLRDMKFDAYHWTHEWMLPSQPDYYAKILSAIAAGNFRQVATRIASTVFETVPFGVMVTVPKIPKEVQWIMYDECNIRPFGPVLKCVDAIPIESLIAAAPLYWLNIVRSLRAGPIRDDIVNAMSRLSGEPRESFLQTMPPRS
jgi:hypothetical protein